MIPPEISGPERLAGAVAGAFLAMVFLLPKSWADFFRRGAGSTVFGAIFASPVREFMEWPMTPEYEVSAGCAAAFSAWTIMAIAIKSIEKRNIDAKK